MHKVEISPVHPVILGVVDKKLDIAGCPLRLYGRQVDAYDRRARITIGNFEYLDQYWLTRGKPSTYCQLPKHLISNC